MAEDQNLRLDPLFPLTNLFPSADLFPSDGNQKGVSASMISFTDKKLYLKGTCQANLTDPCTGDVVYSSNKFQTGNITTSVSMGEIRAGMGNAVATILPSDSALNVEFTAADFNLWAKAAQMGATLNYGAPAPECETMTTGTNLNVVSVSLPYGPPVAPLGFSEPICYVQEVGASGEVSETGTAYPITSSGVVEGYNGKYNTEYRVHYFVNKASAQVATIGTLFNPRVLHFTAQMPVFSNENCSATNEGSRVGWLYVVVPRLKLSANGGVVGDQTTADTTSISGQAVAFDSDVVGRCGSCGSGTLAYYVYVPDSGASEISGLAVVGGVVSVRTNTQTQIPVRFVMKNGELVAPANYSDNFTYTATGAPSGTAVSAAGIINSGATAGDFDISIKYNNDGEELTVQVAAEVLD